MKVTREEIIKLAMRAESEGQYEIGDRLRGVALYLDPEYKRFYQENYSIQAVKAIETNIMKTSDL